MEFDADCDTDSRLPAGFCRCPETMQSKRAFAGFIAYKGRIVNGSGEQILRRSCLNQIRREAHIHE